MIHIVTAAKNIKSLSPILSPPPFLSSSESSPTDNQTIVQEFCPPLKKDGWVLRDASRFLLSKCSKSCRRYFMFVTGNLSSTVMLNTMYACPSKFSWNPEWRVFFPRGIFTVFEVNVLGEGKRFVEFIPSLYSYLWIPLPYNTLIGENLSICDFLEVQSILCIRYLTFVTV